VAVGVVQGVGHLGGDPDGVGHRQLLLPIEALPERLALDERHHVEQEAVGLARVEQGQDVRVLQVGGELDLGQEALGPDHGCELGAQELQGDPAIVAEIMCQVDGGHAAGADLALDAVAVGQRGLQTAERLGHDGAPGWDAGKMGPCAGLDQSAEAAAAVTASPSPRSRAG
jgi:hypothetical protein